MKEWELFLFTLVIGLIGSIVGTYLSKPTDRKVLENFYRKTKPFGFWGPLKQILPADESQAMRREHRCDILALPFVLGWHITLFIWPMQLIVKTYGAFAITFTIFLVCLVGMYFLWYRNLPPAAAPVETDTQAA